MFLISLEGVDFIARNDGVNRTVVRNVAYKKSSINIRERHNERKNDIYSNPDILVDKSHLNIHFKECNSTYISAFEKLCHDGIICTRGLKVDANIIDEMVFDVNSNYFENNGGYEYAKEFFSEAYKMAVSEVGGEQFIVSAVMHADERNKALSEELGKDVFHYHLHVVYVPVVEKKILWSKRCKDKDLIGTIKEVVTQVSHSKKWSSEKYVDELGKTKLISSYSKLQDRFFEHMQSAGYDNIQRGEKGSKDEHLHHTEFKLMKEQQRLDDVVKNIKNKKVSLKNIDNITVKNTMLDSGKVIVDKEEFDDVKLIAKKHIVSSNNEKKLIAKVKTLEEENKLQKTELFELKSVKNKLSIGKLDAEMSNLKRTLDKVLMFVKLMGLSEKLDNYLKQNINNER